MLEIIPSINAPTFAEVQRQIVKVEPYVSWCHIDVTDGVFSSHPTWREPADLARLKTSLNAEVHLMIAEPDKMIAQWLVPPVRRVIVHLEATKNPEALIHQCREAGIEIGLAVNPDTPWTLFEPWFGRADLFLPLGVAPGASGQKPDWDVILGKIAAIRQACPSCIIEADGGVNRETAQDVGAAGANILVAGSAIFEASDIAQSINALRNLNS
ncbi:MAG: hypothetical protein HYT41_02920 [Candidatus Sungbacteria bacterium]|nr:hypothetical protein [Candidatus Sungbacteria bacterium]